MKVQYEQVERLKKLREKRNNEAVKISLANLEKVAKTDENLMPHILNCVEQYCTLGEICNVLRGVFGEYQESVVL